MKKSQNEIAHSFLKGSDLASREQEILRDACQKLGFVPDKLLGRSAWWGSAEIGAFHYSGKYQGKKSVLKIQGLKPSISEIYMINSFAKTNKSKIIRPPYLYASLPWDDQKRYEALILEFVEGEKIIQTPTTQEQVKKFFEIYQEYKTNCLSSPWVDKLTKSLSDQIIDNFKKWREISFKIYPTHPLRDPKDQDLIDVAVEVLKKAYQGMEPEFMHCHVSEVDLYQVEDQVVILSNLFWSWRPPLYDAVFGYHWFIYHLNMVGGITPEKVEEQRSLWLDEIRDLPQVREKGEKLLNLALLERATAGLNLDVLSADPKKPITKYLFESTRDQIKKLILILR
ncbi:MAG: hypothetical protein Q7R43_01370 [Candidatus Daviesbacteria bacterium]|nr:hypothetical protein [Candidatus Daviesbacteria bacterium]